MHRGGRGGWNVHIGMLSRQTTSWTDARMLNRGVALVFIWTSHSKALSVKPKLKMFLKMIMQVKPSIAKSPGASVSSQRSGELVKGRGY